MVSMKFKNYGLIIEQPEPENYILGGLISLPKIVLQPDGQWEKFLPLPEFQNLNAIET
jgi:hypothetical protein